MQETGTVSNVCREYCFAVRGDGKTVFLHAHQQRLALADGTWTSGDELKLPNEGGTVQFIVEENPRTHRLRATQWVVLSSAE